MRGDKANEIAGRHRKIRFDPWRLIIILVPCILFLPELIGYSQFAGWDVTRLNLPLKLFDVQAVREGTTPLWNNFLYAGMPQLAESETGLYYPGNWLLHIPGNFFYWANLTYILHFILAGLFMDLWLRSRKIPASISFFGAILYMASPFLLFHISSMAIFQSIAWFPLLLWLADRILDKKPGKVNHVFYYGMIMLLGGLLVLIGSAQMAFFQGFLLVFYLIGHMLSFKQEKPQLRRYFGVIGFLALGAILIGAIIWIPAMEFSASTVREASGKSFYRLGTWLHPGRLASLFVFPAYGVQTEMVGWASSLAYIGLLPTLLASARLTGIRSKWKNDAPLIVMGFIALIFAFGMYNPLTHLLIKFPPFSMFRYFGRFAIGLLVPLIALAAHFITDRFISSESEPTPVTKRSGIIHGAIVLFVLVIIFVVIQFKSDALKLGLLILVMDIALTGIFIALVHRRNNPRNVASILVIYLVFHCAIMYPVGRLATMRMDRYQQSLEFFDLIKRDDGLPPRLLVTNVGRFADRDLLDFNRWAPQDNLPNICSGNTGLFRDVQVMDPYTPMRPVEWHELIRGEIASGFLSADETGTLDMETTESLESLGIDAIVTNSEINQIDGYSRQGVDLTDFFGPDARLFIAENEKPRARIVGSAGGESLSADRFEYIPNGVLVNYTAPSGYNRINIEVSYDDNLVAFAEEEQLAVEREGVFISLEIPEGSHRLRILYVDSNVVFGCIMMSVGLILAVFLLLIGLIPRKST